MLLLSARITWTVAGTPCCLAAGQVPPGPAWLVWAGSCPVSPRWRSTWAPARPSSLTAAAPPRSYASPPSRVAAPSDGAAAPSVDVISRKMDHCLGCLFVNARQKLCVQTLCRRKNRMDTKMNINKGKMSVGRGIIYPA